MPKLIFVLYLLETDNIYVLPKLLGTDNAVRDDPVWHMLSGTMECNV
jgi:hypothetical protein